MEDINVASGLVVLVVMIVNLAQLLENFLWVISL